MADTKKVIVIGGGIAGLSAGIYALKAGFEAEIYEKNTIPGGECIGWNRKGYHIDNCIHWLTGTLKGTELYDVWKTVGALSDDTEYAKIDSFYTSTYNGQKATLWNDLERTQRELIAVSPEDEEEIRKFIQNVEWSKQCLFPARKPMEMWGIKDYIEMGKNMADFPKVMKEFGKISLEEYSKRFKSPLLQKLMCDYLPKSYCAYSFLVSYATMAMAGSQWVHPFRCHFAWRRSSRTSAERSLTARAYRASSSSVRPLPAWNLKTAASYPVTISSLR